MLCVDEVARQKIEDHETQCVERHTIMRAAISRIEKVLIGVAGGLILYLANVILKVI